MDYVRKRYASSPFSRALVVGCGNGWVERDLFDRGIATRFDAFDVSEQYLAAAEAHRGSRDIRYFRSDFATFEPDGRYDLIVNVAALHHAQRLHGLVRKLAQAAAPDGIFVNWDYVGPSRNQYTTAQVRLMREVNESLPLRFRSRHTLRPSLRQMLATDPTEAVHSAEIIDAVSAYFDVVERRDLGGGIAYQLLWNNLAEFEKADEDARRTLQRLLELDWNYTRAGRVPTLFSFSSACRECDP